MPKIIAKYINIYLKFGSIVGGPDNAEKANDSSRAANFYLFTGNTSQYCVKVTNDK